MKIKHKALNIARAAMLGMALLVAGGLGAQSARHNSHVKGGPKDNVAIEKDVNNITAQKARVASLKKKLKDDCKAGNKEAAVIDRKELRKAQADLKRDKAYLVADTKDVASDDNLVISNWKKIVKQDEAELKASRKSLDKAKAHNDKAAIDSETSHVALYEKRLQADKDALDREKQKKNEDMTFVKDEVKQAGGKRSWFSFARF